MLKDPCWRRSLASAFVLALLAVCVPARAQAPDVGTLARRHFDRGLAYTDEGEIAAAAREFEQAYALRPHPAVLFNLGSAYSALGKSVEAVRVLTQYLSSSTDLTPPRRDRVEKLIRANEARIGSVELALSPQNSRVIVDGGAPLDGPFTAPVRLSEGTHVFLVEAPGHVPELRVLSVRGATSVSLSVTLAASSLSARETGQLVIRCPVRDVQVSLDGKPVDRTPLAAPLIVAIGQHQVRFERAGYASTESIAAVSVSALADVHCALRPLPRLPPELSGSFAITPTPSDSTVTLDGAPFRAGATPIGVHQVNIERPGFRAFSDAVTLEPGKTRRLSITLAATPELYAERVASARRQRTFAIVSGAAGLLLGAGAGIAYAVHSNRYEDWQTRAFALEEELREGLAGDQAVNEFRDVVAQAASIERLESAATGLAITAGVALASAAVLWFTAPELPPTSPRVGSARPLLFTW